MDPFSSNHKDTLAFITGSQKVPASHLSARSSAVIIMRMIKMIKSELKFFPNFENFGDRIYHYQSMSPDNHWHQFGWEENHEGRVAKLAEVGFPDGITEKTRVICLLRYWGNLRQIFILTRAGQLYLFGWTEDFHAKPKRPFSAWMKRLSVWDLAKILKEGHIKDPDRSNTTEQQLRCALMCLIEEHVKRRKWAYRSALDLLSRFKAVSSRIDEHC